VCPWQVSGVTSQKWNGIPPTHTHTPPKNLAPTKETLTKSFPGGLERSESQTYNNWHKIWCT